MRLMSSSGTVHVLSQSFKVGKRPKFEYIKATLDTKQQTSRIMGGDVSCPSKLKWE